MDVKFDSFDDYFKGFHPHSLVYSWNGTGKTTLAGRTGLRTILFDCSDAGVMTLKKNSPKNLRIIRITSTDHYMAAIEQVLRVADKIDLLVIDTLTGLQSTAIRQVKGKKGDMNQKKWGMVGSRVIECIAETRNFPKDVIYLAQEKRKRREDEEGTVQVIAPSITPSVREYLSSCVDWVGRLYMEDDKRKLSFVLSDTVEAKDRSNLFPKPLVLPNDINKSVYPIIRQRIIEAIGA